MTNYGFIYCLSNPMISDVYYINYSHSNPYEILHEMNMNEGNVFDNKMELIKRINNFELKGELTESLLNQLGVCVNPKRNFYQLDINIIQGIFALIDGEWIN